MPDTTVDQDVAEGDTIGSAVVELRAAGAKLPDVKELDDLTYVNKHELLVEIGDAHDDLAAKLTGEQGHPYEPGAQDEDPRVAAYGPERADINARLRKAGVPVELWAFPPNVDVLDVQQRFAHRGVHLNRVLLGAKKMTGGGSAGGPVPAAEPGCLPDTEPEPNAAPMLVVLDSGLPTKWREWFPELEVAVSPFSTTNKTDDLTVNPERHQDDSVGHGLFVSGIVRQVEPTVKTAMRRVLRWRLGDDAFLAAELAAVTEPVVNLSLLAGGPVGGPPPVGMRAAIEKLVAADTVVVAAAGNGLVTGDEAVGFDLGVDLDVWPAMLEGVIGVGAMDVRQIPPVPCRFSNHGRSVDVWAPGIGVRSTFLRDVTISGSRFAGWATWHGTSFAAPMVAARIARLIAEDGGKRTHAQVARDFLDGLPSSTFPGGGKLFDPKVPGLVVAT